MQGDILIWVKEAEDNLVTAKLLYENDRFKDASFYAQQVAEKSLKAVQIKNLRSFSRIHDLVSLAQSINAPGKVVSACADLTRYYIDSRYPITKMVNDEEAKDALGKCEGVLEWAKSTLKL